MLFLYTYEYIVPVDLLGATVCPARAAQKRANSNGSGGGWEKAATQCQDKKERYGMRLSMPYFSKR